MSAVLAVLYVFLAVLLGTQLVYLFRLVPPFVRRQRGAARSAASTSEVILAMLTCACCAWLVPDLRPAALGDAWHWKWVDAVPVLLGATYALLTERNADTNTTN